MPTIRSVSITCVTDFVQRKRADLLNWMHFGSFRRHRVEFAVQAIHSDFVSAATRFVGPPAPRP